MKLISSSDTLIFLSQAAPRPWVTRMMLWMIVNGEIAAYATKASVRAHVSAFRFLYELAEKAGEATGSKMDAAIRETYAPVLAEQLVGKGTHDQVYDEPQGWDDAQDPQVVDAGVFFYANEIDWEEGTLRAKDIPGERTSAEFLFPNEELYGTEFEEPEFDVELSGISFDFQAVEMLLPNLQILSPTIKLDSGDRARPTGRPPKWNWEGALAYVASQAQEPDGLPTGPGAQARLEGIIAEWFMRETGGAPASSQIRQRASSVIRMLEQPIKPNRPKKD